MGFPISGYGLQVPIIFHVVSVSSGGSSGSSCSRFHHKHYV